MEAGRKSMKYMAVKLNNKTGKLEEGKKYNSEKKARKKAEKLKKKGFQVIMMYSANGLSWSSF